MLKLYLSLRHLWADKRGVTAIEYAVLAGAVGTALIAIGASGAWSDITTAITGALGAVNDPNSGT